MAAVINFCTNLFHNLSDMGLNLLDFLNTSFEIPTLGTFSIFDMLFGVGATFYLTYVIIKFLLPTS